MADTFTSSGTIANLWIYTEGIERQNSARVVERGLPWASNVVLDLTGPTANTLTVTAYTTSATEVQTLVDLRSGYGTLVWEAGDDIGWLRSVTPMNWFGGRWRDVKLEFILEY